jgi:hypothetical protein
VSRYHDQVAAAVAAVTIRGRGRYAWLGQAGGALPPAIDAALDDTERHRHLIACLREELYRSFYCHGRPVPARRGEFGPAAADPRLAAELSQANAGRGSWEGGWTVARLDGDEAVVSGERLRMRIGRGDCRPRDAAPGAPVNVRLPKELPSLAPGFFSVVSDARADPAHASTVRVYWNVSPAGAPDLVGALTRRLNRDGVPFGLKVADHPLRFERCDAAVLYLGIDDFRARREALRELAATLAVRLRPPVPAFTLELAPGVGLAEDGGGDASFGERRCALLADGIVRAHDEGLRDPLDAVAARFAEAGVRIDAPYLEPSLDGHHAL